MEEIFLSGQDASKVEKSGDASKVGQMHKILQSFFSRTEKEEPCVIFASMGD